MLEKEEAPARHQTGHNSGVIHSGIYYKPGSLKARFSRAGGAALTRFCEERGIRYEVCGKVIVATEAGELPRLEDLYRRGLENGLAVEKVGPEELREIEPHATGLAAIRVPTTGIVDYGAVARAFAAEIGERGGELRTGAPVEAVSETGDGVEVISGGETVRARTLVNCAGLYSDRVARMAGVEPGMKIVPFRGEYYELVPHRRDLVRNLVYPVPDPSFPFLGVHFTRMIDGNVHAGPNAVLALAREGYDWRTVVPRDLADALTHRGFHRLARRYWRTGAGEMYRSASKRAFVRALQRLVPDVRAEDLVRSGAGVRAQALAADGRLVDDFAFDETPNAVHVINAPSPAATASLEIGRVIAERALPDVPARRAAA